MFRILKETFRIRFFFLSILITFSLKIIIHNLSPEIHYNLSYSYFFHSEYPFVLRTIFTIWSCSKRVPFFSFPFLPNLVEVNVLFCNFPILLLFRISTLGIFVWRRGDVALGESSPLSELFDGSIVLSFLLRFCSNLLKNLEREVKF